MTQQARPDQEPLVARLMHWLFGFRYIKFGLVGASGTVVNMAVLYVAQEYLLAAIADPRQRLYGSLALAIALATVNNFTWNRLWTWADRVQLAHQRHLALQRTPWTLLAGQFWRYAAASWLGIALQYGLTLWLAHTLHYLVANVIAIVIASVSNYLANDFWTFGQRKPK
ncbi:MAG: GtrA family protein [Rhodoferax sp.]|nr:GtrA family protein [Rhodoferax sp.]